MFEIRNDAPVPEAYQAPSIYPFRKLKVGDSFIIPDGKVAAVKKAAGMHRVRNMPWSYRIGKDQEGNTRLWRIEDTGKRIKGQIKHIRILKRS